MAIKTVTKWGNSLGITIPKVLCKSMGLDVKDKVEVVAGNNEIIIRPIKETSSKKTAAKKPKK